MALLLLGPPFMAGQSNHKQSNLPAPFTGLSLLASASSPLHSFSPFTPSHLSFVSFVYFVVSVPSSSFPPSPRLPPPPRLIYYRPLYRSILYTSHSIFTRSPP